MPNIKNLFKPFRKAHKKYGDESLSPSTAWEDYKKDLEEGIFNPFGLLGNLGATTAYHGLQTIAPAFYIGASDEYPDPWKKYIQKDFEQGNMFPHTSEWYKKSPQALRQTIDDDIISYRKIYDKKNAPHIPYAPDNFGWEDYKNSLKNATSLEGGLNLIHDTLVRVPEGAMLNYVKNSNKLAKGIWDSYKTGIPNRMVQHTPYVSNFLHNTNQALNNMDSLDKFNLTPEEKKYINTQQNERASVLAQKMWDSSNPSKDINNASVDMINRVAKINNSMYRAKPLVYPKGLEEIGRALSSNKKEDMSKYDLNKFQQAIKIRDAYIQDRGKELNSRMSQTNNVGDILKNYSLEEVNAANDQSKKIGV